MNRYQLLDLGKAAQNLLHLHCQDAFCCYDDCLGGGCAIAAYATHRVLSKLKVSNTLVMGEDREHHTHAWVQVPVHGTPYAFDATASQFYCKHLHPFENEDLEAPERAVGVVVEPLLAYRARFFYDAYTYRRKTNEAAFKAMATMGTQSPSCYTEAIDDFIDAQVHRFSRSVVVQSADAAE